MSFIATLIGLLSVGLSPWVQPVLKPPYNFLRNGDASQGRERWDGSREPSAQIETTDGNPCFVLHSGILQQEVTVSEGNVALWIAFVGAASSEVIRPDGLITGRPYLWGAARTQEGRYIYSPSYQGGTMMAHSTVADEWELLWGVFAFPKEASEVVFQISQGRNARAPVIESSARFDDLALFVASSQAEAYALLDRYRSTRATFTTR
jgi:hypothetical protein